VIPLASNLAERGKAGKPITELKVRESTQHILAELLPQEVAAVQQKQPSKRNITTAPWIAPSGNSCRHPSSVIPVPDQPLTWLTYPDWHHQIATEAQPGHSL